MSLSGGSSSRSPTLPRAPRARARCASTPTARFPGRRRAVLRAATELDRSEGELSDVRARLEQALAEADAARAERDRLAEELRDERGRARALAANLRSTHGAATDLDEILPSSESASERRISSRSVAAPCVLRRFAASARARPRSSRSSSARRSRSARAASASASPAAGARHVAQLPSLRSSSVAARSAATPSPARKTGPSA